MRVARDVPVACCVCVVVNGGERDADADRDDVKDPDEDWQLETDAENVVEPVCDTLACADKVCDGEALTDSDATPLLLCEDELVDETEVVCERVADAHALGERVVHGDEEDDRDGDGEPDCVFDALRDRDPVAQIDCRDVAVGVLKIVVVGDVLVDLEGEAVIVSVDDVLRLYVAQLEPDKDGEDDPDKDSDGEPVTEGDLDKLADDDGESDGDGEGVPLSVDDADCVGEFDCDRDVRPDTLVVFDDDSDREDDGDTVEQRDTICERDTAALRV